MNRKSRKKLTIIEVEDILNQNNTLLNDKVLHVLYDKFNYKSIYCLYMLPEQEDLYQVLIDGILLVDFEVNKETNEFLFTSQMNIKDYLYSIKDPREKEFLQLASKIGRMR